MAEILRTRRISPDTRKASSKSYKVVSENVGLKDTLRVEITHAIKPGRWIYKFTGAQIAGKESISFRVKEDGGKVNISWGSLNPLILSSTSSLPATAKSVPGKKIVTSNSPNTSSTHLKKSLPPIVDKNTKILILGSLPGDESLRLQQYYANPRNQFWRILAGVWNESVTELYGDRFKWLLRHNIGVWDVCHSAQRQGSLDQDIENVIPNDLRGLLKDYPNIKTILFNGKEAGVTFEKHFVKRPEIHYETVISSSGAATVSLDKKLLKWKQVIIRSKEVGDE